MIKAVHLSFSEVNFRKILVLVVIINGCHQENPCYSLSYKDIDEYSENYFRFNQELNSRTNSSGSYNC